jgi:thiamine-monophosphate kinase
VPCADWLRTLLAQPDTHALALGWMLAGGEDYELCFTAPSAMDEQVRTAGRSSAVAVTAIGRISTGSQLQILDAEGRAIDPSALRPYDHFG